MKVKKINLPFKVKKTVLALGSQTKNTICFLKGKTAFLSPVHADLNKQDDLLEFEKDAKSFLGKNPQVIAFDLHPEYQSSKYAQAKRAVRQEMCTTQHHHAHIASCMVENRFKNQKVIGVAFDGTGLGINNTLWGAEFLVCDYLNFRRAAHLKEIPLLGGERAILEPWRIAAIWLYLMYQSDKFLKLSIAFSKKLNKNKWRVLKEMYLKEVNSPLASSMGRLFDAAGSIILGKHKASFDAELAILLEKKAKHHNNAEGSYKFGLAKKDSCYILSPLVMFGEIIRDLRQGKTKERIAFCFHVTIAEMIKKICLRLKKDTGINKVILCGGVFQNRLLLSLSTKLLLERGFKVFTHTELPNNDSSLSLGQAVIAGLRSEKCV